MTRWTTSGYRSAGTTAVVPSAPCRRYSDVCSNRRRCCSGWRNGAPSGAVTTAGSAAAKSSPPRKTPRRQPPQSQPPRPPRRTVAAVAVCGGVGAPASARWRRSSVAATRAAPTVTGRGDGDASWDAGTTMGRQAKCHYRPTTAG